MKKLISLFLAFIMLFSAGGSFVFAEEGEHPIPTEDEIAVEADYDWLTGEGVIHYGRYYNDIRGDVNLPVTGHNGSTIEWNSSDESVIATDGAVTQPPFSYAIGNVEVTLTATIFKGAESRQKTFSLEVVPQPPTDADDVAKDKAWLTYDIILNDNSADNVKSILNLPTQTTAEWVPAGYYGGCSIDWLSSDPGVIASDGTVTRPQKNEGNKEVTLTASISKGEAADTKAFALTVTPVEEFPLAISYNGFSDTSFLQFNGVSGTVGTKDRYGNDITALRFNNDRTEEAAVGGSVFTKNKIRLGQDISFSTAFSYRNPHPDFTLGTGGITFTLQTVSEAVYGTGLHDESIKPGVSIAFVTDYYSNTGSGGQGTSYHYRDDAVVYYNGDYENRTVQYLNDGNTNDPAPYNNVWIEYDGNSRVLEIRYSTNTIRPANSNLRIEDLDLAEILTGAEEGLDIEDVRDVYAGFMGSWGNAKDKSEIGSWYLKNDAVPIDFAPYDFIDASNVVLTANPPAGEASSIITVLVSGMDGTPVAGMPVNFETSFGTLDITSSTTDASGCASTVLSSGTSGTANVKVIVTGGATATTEIQLSATDEDRLNFDIAWLTFNRIKGENSLPQSITYDLDLPSNAPNGSAISWESSNPEVVSEEGTVTRPSILQGAQEVILSVEITIGSLSQQKTFTINVKVRDEDLAAADRDWLTDGIILNGNPSLNNITSNLYLPTSGENGSSISWASDETGILAVNGNVNRPTYTQGNQPVTLTATIEMGMVTFEKEFNLAVIALEATDAEAVYADYSWLTDSIILNGNAGMNQVLSDLNLPVTGLYGSEIHWESTDETYAAVDGTIVRPTYTQGAKIITLTVTVVKGSAQYIKTFHITVIPYAIDEEVLKYDYSWLTYSRIIGDSSGGYVTGNLNLPEVGSYGSSISWSSDNEAIIKSDGTVTRPSFSQGNRLVALTAILTKGSKNLTKEFVLGVKKLVQSDTEAIFADKSWLRVSNTLGNNLSQKSVKENLVLPSVGPNGCMITWDSDTPSVISASGQVTIPEYSQGHKSVVLTATFTKGSDTGSTTFNYTVLSKPDTFPPVVTSTVPANNSTDILWNTSEITVTFDEAIKAAVPENSAGNYGIELSGTEVPGIIVSIFQNKLSVKLRENLKPGTEYVLVVPDGTISDSSGNTHNDEIRVSFSVEQKPKRTIEIVSSSPDDREKDVSSETKSISFVYNYNDITWGKSFENIALRNTLGNKVGASVTLDGDTVTLTLNPGVKLQPAVVYEVYIPSDAVMDRFENSSLSRSIKFRTESSSTLPSVVDYYPKDGQTGIDIHHRIIVSFTEPVSSKDCKLVLLDDKGQKVKTDILAYNDMKTVVIKDYYYSRLKPNTKYTIAGPYDIQDSSAGIGFEVSFTTGTNTLGITNGHLLTGGLLPVNTPIVLDFSAHITQSTEFNKIRVSDSYGNMVSITASTVNNKLVLAPNSPLTPSETYEFYIPKDALRNQNGAANDAVLFLRTAAERLNYGNYSFYTPSTLVTQKILTFDARWLGEISRPLKSITWDFGDGKSGSGLYPSTIYWSSGKYKVMLTLIDDMDIAYKFEKTITINDLNLKDMKISVYPNEPRYLTVFDDNNQYGIKNVEPFSITMYSPTIGYIKDEALKVSLYKKGTFVEHLGNAVSRYNGEAQFIFNYGNKGYFGTYELVFEHSKTKQQVRVPVIISEATSRQRLTIELFDRDTNHFIETKEDLYFVVDGKKVLGKYEDIEGAPYGVFVINSLEIGKKYSIKLADYKDAPYVSNLEEVYHQGSDFPGYLPVIKKQPGLKYIKSQMSSSGSANGSKGLFIKNVSIPDLSFELDGNWDGLTPGYYELKSSMGSISLKSDKPVFDLQPGLQMHAGEELWGRMVSKTGVASLWENANVTVAPYPSLDFGPSLNISYTNGKYIVDADLEMSSLTGGKIGILDKVPLLDSAPSFGLGSSHHRFDGSIDEYGVLRLLYMYNDGHGMSTKRSKALTTGYEVEADITFYGLLAYDKRKNEWRLGSYRFFLSGRGEYYWKRPYTIPELDIGGWGKLAMGSNIDAELAIYSEDKEFKGILEFIPYVTVSIGAGIENVLSVEGYVTGSVPAQFHIPTGYMEVEPSIEAGIVAYYIFDSSELYHKVIAETQWDNGKEKVKFLSPGFMGELEEEDTGFTPTPRNYLERGSQWLAGSSLMQKSMMVPTEMMTISSTGSNPQIDAMAENIYPRAEVQLISDDSRQWMVWTEDNPLRDADNRTQLKYSMFDGGSWSEPEWFGYGATADFAPTAAASGDGMLLAWQNVKNLMTEETKKVSYVEDSEIKVTRSIYNGNGDEPDIIALTDDDKFDHLPVLAADSGRAMLVWTKSEGLSLTFGDEMEGLRSPANSDRLFSSVWNGSTWSAPAEIEGSLPYVFDSSLTMHGNEGLLLYTLDMDNNLLTNADREVYYRIHDGAAWGGAIRLTDNDAEDSAPKAANVEGEWFITWNQDGSVVYKAGLEDATQADEFLSAVPANYKLAVMEGANPQLAIVYTMAGENSTSSLSASFYDINKGIWSDRITLSDNAGYIRSFIPVFTEAGVLKAVYTQAEVISQVIEQTEFQLPSDKVDLIMLSYTPVHDLALDTARGLQLVPSIPVQGATTNISVVVKNNGDFAENATLYLYDGDSSEGRLIGRADTQEPIAARSEVQMEFEWLVEPEERNKYQLYAVVYPEGGIEEADDSNNSLSLEIVTTDVAVTALECENIAGNNYLVKATVANTGGLKLEGVAVQLVHAQSSQILETRTIDSMMPGQEIGLSYLFSSDGLTANEDGDISMTLNAILINVEEEFSTENNSYDFNPEPASITVDSMDPAPNETQINIEKQLSIKFNMSVEEGARFEDIELIDEDLNEIKITRIIDGRALTITPETHLEYGTEYTLTIPAEAVSDPYGHIMDVAYSVSFETTSTNPEVIFAFPGSGMEDMAPDTEIKVKYNQNIMEGPDFDSITLYNSSLNEVYLYTSIEGEWLYIRPAVLLGSGEEYTLTIPEGAVQNAIGELQRENHVVRFKTKVSEDVGNDSSSLLQKSYMVARDGNGTAIIDILEHKVSKAGNETDVTIDLTDEVKNDQFINVNLSGDVLKKLAGYAAGLNIVTGKGNIHLPGSMVGSLIDAGKGSIIVTAEISTGNKESGARPSVKLTLMLDGKRMELKNPGKPFEVTIPYSPEENELSSPESIIIRGIDGGGSKYAVTGSYYDTETGLVSFKETRFGLFVVEYNNVNFIDVFLTSWYNKAVKFIAARGITNGTGDGKYSPEARLTRGQFIAMLMRIYNIAPDENTDDNFVDAGNTYYTGYLAAAKQLGISNGVGQNKFMPDKEITREEMFTLLYNTLKSMDRLPEGSSGKTLTQFDDAVQISSWAKEALQLLAETGTIAGSGGRLLPAVTATRAEMAQVLYNLLLK